MNAIEINNLTKYYGRVRGIEGINLSVKEGDFFGFIGPNGAGKSTTIRTLLGLIRPTSGGAEVLGLNIVKDNLEILRNVGYQPGEATFYRGMRVSEILDFAAKLRKSDCKEERDRLCEILELDPSKRADTLSLGNRKKVGIVCALQHKPKLYILDEPTSGLDPLMQKRFYDLLTERNREGATVFLSSHVLSEVAKYCRSAAIIRDGSILAADSVANLARTDVKRITLRGCSGFSPIEGVKNVETEGDSISFLFGGGKEKLLALLNSLSFEDFTVAEPDLGEIFMHYYEKEEK